MNTRVNRLANALIAEGIASGDRVALYLPNIPAFVIGYLATVRIGALAVSANAMLKAEELKYILDDAGAPFRSRPGPGIHSRRWREDIGSNGYQNLPDQVGLVRIMGLGIEGDQQVVGCLFYHFLSTNRWLFAIVRQALRFHLLHLLVVE
ncbi:MAG: AMP-binding protein [Desulfosarcina sp.]|nr:AMP-binding protein [Desulfosarcina sp.]